MKNLMVAFLALFSGEAEASNILFQQSYAAGFAITAAHELLLEGENVGREPATLIVRIDDAGSSGYASRVNEEWVVLPGSFTLHLPVASFQTPKKRKLDLNALKSLRVFTASNDVLVSDVKWEKSEPIGKGVLALDFGPSGSAVSPGFEALTESDPRLSGKLEAVERPYLDALVSDGVRGIERITLAAEPGTYQLTLWTEDIGQWETPPRYVERRIKINGEVVLHERFSDRDWRVNRYLQNVNTKGIPTRGRPQTFPVTVGPSDRSIEIAFAGDNKTALFVSGLLIEKGQVPRIRDELNAMREQRFAALWPIVDGMEGKEGSNRPTVKVAPGGIAELEILMEPKVHGVIDSVMLDLPEDLSGEVRLAQARLVRPDPQKRLLVRDDRTLRGNVVGTPLQAGEAQTFHILLFADRGIRRGHHTGRLSINQQQFEFSIQVMSSSAGKIQVGPEYRGVYLDYSYYLSNRSEQRSQLWCDVAYLAKLGFTTIAPPFALEVATFKKDYAFYQAAGFDGPIFVYAALKRWIKKYGIEEAASRVAQVNQPNLIWSIADEPSNPGMDSTALEANVKKLRQMVPDIRLAGHLNSKHDREFADLFDVVLVNAGFVDELDVIPAKIELWFYNVQQTNGKLPSFVAQSKTAKGVLQWHARNPLGDPYDPTDGREGDASFLLPTAEVCPVVPDIYQHLIKLND